MLGQKTLDLFLLNQSVTTPIEVPDSDSISGSFTAAVESVFFGARPRSRQETKLGPGQASSLYYYYYDLPTAATPSFSHRHGTKIVARSLQFFDTQIHSRSLAQNQLHVGQARGWPLGILVDRLTFTGATLFTTLSDTKSNRVPRPKS